ncbi:MAG: hypothetical protein R3F46_03895 [bacterium]
MDLKDVISLVDLAARFAKAKGMDNLDYQWLRTAPGRGSSKREKVGNSLAVLKAIRAFNDSNSKAIQVYNAKGYDGTPKKVMVIEKGEIIRLKGFLLRGGSQKRGRTKETTEFKIIGKAEV